MKTYNFFDVLTLKTEFNRHSGYERYFDNEYKRIVKKSGSNSKCIIEIVLVDSLPASEKGDITRSVTYKKLFNYHYLIRGLDKPSTTIYFKRHFIDRIYMNAIGVFLQAQLLEPIMYKKLLKEGVLFMHAGGVANEKSGYLMAAHGGTGKTTFSIALLNNGFKLLGDDLLFVNSKTGIVHPYPRPMHIFTYNINNLQGAHVPFKYKAIIYTKNALRFVLERVLQIEFLISTRIHADEVFPGKVFADSVPYKKIFFLKKEGPAVTRQPLSETNYKSIAKEIMISADLNDSLYEIVQDKKKIEAVEQDELRVTAGLLKQFEYITYINTRKLDLDNLEVFIKEEFDAA